MIHKDWWDPGHDPSRTAMTVTEFLGGKMHHEIERELGPRILANALETVERLASGGPGAAEPPDQGYPLCGYLASPASPNSWQSA